MTYPETFPYLVIETGHENYAKSCERCHTDKLPGWLFRVKDSDRPWSLLGWFCQAECARRYYWPIYCKIRLTGKAGPVILDEIEDWPK